MSPQQKRELAEVGVLVGIGVFLWWYLRKPVSTTILPAQAPDVPTLPQNSWLVYNVPSSGPVPGIDLPADGTITDPVLPAQSIAVGGNTYNFGDNNVGGNNFSLPGIGGSGGSGGAQGCGCGCSPIASDSFASAAGMANYYSDVANASPNAYNDLFNLPTWAMFQA